MTQQKVNIPHGKAVRIAPGIEIWHDRPEGLEMTVRYEEEAISQQSVATEPAEQGEDDN